MDVSFTDIANVETGASREDIAFSDLEAVGLYDGGRFFGPNHAEAAGVFGYNELIGAFGARKQE